MTMTIEHNGRDLTFREDDETWSCREMNMTAKSLKALKSKLDKFDGQARKVSAPVLVIDHWGKTERAEIVMIAKPKDWEKTYQGSRYVGVPSVWVTKVNGNKVERSKQKLENCLAINTENQVILDSVTTKRNEIARLEGEAKALLASIPRITIEELTTRAVGEDDSEDEA